MLKSIKILLAKDGTESGRLYSDKLKEAGFEVVCVDEDYTNYEYMVRMSNIESMSYILKIKNEATYADVDETLQSIFLVLPAGLKNKLRKLAKKKDIN